MSVESVTTADGRCPAHVFRPLRHGSGPWPAVLVLMDALAIRPAMLEIGDRLADNGYLALVPDLFYRFGPYPPADPRVALTDPEISAARRKKVNAALQREAIQCDVGACLDWFARQPDVLQDRIGATGYCMGARVAFTAAGLFPDRFKAVALFHGGNFATDAPDSAHLLAPRMRARIYVARASEDATFTDDMEVRLASALREAGVPHAIETYSARHGWVFHDMPVYDAAAHARHWDAMLQLFGETLKTG